MKKLILIIPLIILLLCCACQTQEAESGGDSSIKLELSSAPRSEIPTLDILLDVTWNGHYGSRSLTEFLKTVPEYKTEYKVSFHNLPSTENPEARNGEITRIRMEMMAGKGPDIIIARNFYDWTGLNPDIKNLFPFPQSAMKQKLFLPLDDYITDAKYMDWDKLLPPLMDAGKDGEGRQMILPLSFNLNTALFETDQYTLTAQLPMTRMEMLDSADAGIQWAGLGLEGYFATALGGKIDYANEELLFTEEELLNLAKKHRTLRQEKEQEGENFTDIGCVVSEISLGSINESFFDLKAPDYYMIPAYNEQGGVTATVGTYAAINNATAYPDQAFAFLDSLLSKEAQQSVDLYSWLPPHMDLCQKQDRCQDGWYLSDWNFQQYSVIWDQINAVEYVTPVYIELAELYQKVNEAEDEAQLESLIHDAYTRMQMILAES